MVKGLIFILLVIALIVHSQPSQELEGKRCVVCNMDINMFPEFTSQVKLKDGTYKFAESTKHIFQYYFKNKERIREIWVKDYPSGKWIDGRRAYYVVVEDGPMGKDIAPFKSKIEAKKFAKGKKVYEFMEITVGFIKHLDMEDHSPKGHK